MVLGADDASIGELDGKVTGDAVVGDALEAELGTLVTHVAVGASVEMTVRFTAGVSLSCQPWVSSFWISMVLCWWALVH